MNPQLIQKPGCPKWAVIPYEYYLRLVTEAEMLQDVQDYDEAKQALANGEGVVPAEVTFQIIDGDPPLKVWRQYLQWNPAQLAAAVGLSEEELIQLESGRRPASREVLTAVAKALNLTVEDLI